MSLCRLLIVWVSFFVVLLSSGVTAGPWQAIESKYHRVYFPSGNLKAASKALALLHSQRPIVSDFTGNQPPAFSVILEEAGQYDNGFVSMAPLKMSLFLSESHQINLLAQHQSWIELLSVHELTHAAQFSIVSKNTRLPVRLFGWVVLKVS